MAADEHGQAKLTSFSFRLRIEVFKKDPANNQWAMILPLDCDQVEYESFDISSISFDRLWDATMPVVERDIDVCLLTAQFDALASFKHSAHFFLRNIGRDDKPRHIRPSIAEFSLVKMLNGWPMERRHLTARLFLEGLPKVIDKIIEPIQEATASLAPSPSSGVSAPMSASFSGDAIPSTSRISNARATQDVSPVLHQAKRTTTSSTPDSTPAQATSNEPALSAAATEPQFFSTQDFRDVDSPFRAMAATRMFEPPAAMVQSDMLAGGAAARRDRQQTVAGNFSSSTLHRGNRIAQRPPLLAQHSSQLSFNQSDEFDEDDSRCGDDSPEADFALNEGDDEDDEGNDEQAKEDAIESSIGLSSDTLTATTHIHTAWSEQPNALAKKERKSKSDLSDSTSTISTMRSTVLPNIVREADRNRFEELAKKILDLELSGRRSYPQGLNMPDNTCKHCHKRGRARTEIVENVMVFSCPKSSKNSLHANRPCPGYDVCLIAALHEPAKTNFQKLQDEISKALTELQALAASSLSGLSTREPVAPLAKRQEDSFAHHLFTRVNEFIPQYFGSWQDESQSGSKLRKMSSALHKRYPDVESMSNEAIRALLSHAETILRLRPACPPGSSAILGSRSHVTPQSASQTASPSASKLVARTPKPLTLLTPTVAKRSHVCLDLEDTDDLQEQATSTPKRPRLEELMEIFGKKLESMTNTIQQQAEKLESMQQQMDEHKANMQQQIDEIKATCSLSRGKVDAMAQQHMDVQRQLEESKSGLMHLRGQVEGMETYHTKTMMQLIGVAFNRPTVLGPSKDV